jgi:hypothetical protein
MADIKYLVGLDVDGNINLNTKELQFASIHPLAANPSSPAPSIGQTYWNTADDELRVYNGSTWIAVGADTNYSQWQITDGSQTDDVTTDQVVKFAANSTPGTAGAVLTGTGTTGDPYLVTYTFPNDDTTYSADVGLTLTGTAFSVNVADSQTTQAPQSITTTTNRLYQVETDDTDHLVVNVPWSDNNDDTTYDLSVGAGGGNSATVVLTDSNAVADSVIISGTTNAIDITENTGTSTITVDLSDTISGDRTFNDNLIIGGDVEINGDLDMAGNNPILNVADPTSAQDAATKAYVDGLVSGGLTFKGTFRADTGLILSGANSGSYLYNCPGGAGTRVAVATGDYYLVATAGGSFYCSGDTLDIGDSIIAVADAAADASVVAGWSIVQSDEGVVSIAASTTGDLLGINLSAATGSVEVGLDIQNLSYADIAPLDKASVMIPIYDGDVASANRHIELSDILTQGKESILIGNGSATTITLQNTGAVAPNKNHGLGTNSTGFMIQLIDVSTGATVVADVVRNTGGDVEISFNTAPAANAIRVLINDINL